MLFKFGLRTEVARNVVPPPDTFVYIQLLNNISNTYLLISVLHVLELCMEVSYLMPQIAGTLFIFY